MNKKDFFSLLDRQHFSKAEVHQLNDWILEYKTIKLNQLPVGVYVKHNHNDPHDEQNDNDLMYTVHFNKLQCGELVGALIGDVKVLFKPIVVTPSMRLVTGLRVGELKAEAEKIWPSAHPITREEWVKLANRKEDYNDLRQILKELSLDLPSIDDHVFCTHLNANDTAFVTRIDIHTGEMNICPATDSDYILCAFD